ncbi:Vacuolar iron transporter 1 [Galdieria sulphuraria]|uniref:Vacuolar iron transporter 1 isoform 1 n=1 Tax=Galdieria sulphuraria TaxID=130081 RepID=M2W143_GALSU|nr:vacuolar iron transporter 1 isoform 1 [Galdieria sulphuraria]EME29341.1 vacuolar iron transporter 1 isoform 1 [Galdieria sulphuraria]GJD05814.1 Vacuolar iron transporter 1 [Galdieria sulphuraria]|eukprot:XP_005705861.1 vacuolar iron transporter 1 isoform 1 [Galdieria sulphuraria]
MSFLHSVNNRKAINLEDEENTSQKETARLGTAFVDGLLPRESDSADLSQSSHPDNWVEAQDDLVVDAGNNSPGDSAIPLNTSQEVVHEEVEASHSSGGGAALRDIVLGMSDGLTVPFALAAGMAGAFASSKIIVLAVLAELTAGGISMGLGGYMSGRTEVMQYSAERKREEWEVVNCPEAEKEEIYDILKEYGLTRAHVRSILEHFEKNPNKWVDFMMKFELGLEEPDFSRPWKSALFVGLSYIVGGIIPLIPYFFIESSIAALKVSVIFTLLALFIFGFAKGHVVSHNRLASAIETMVIGAVAAASAFIIARWFDSLTHATQNS